MPDRKPTVLVVEDDDETLNVLSRTLTAAGYDVVWARNGPQTLNLLTWHEDPISLMILDVVLPDTTGPELARKINREHPEARVIYVSAHDAETVRSYGVDPRIVPFLSKIDVADHLLRKVKELL